MIPARGKAKFNIVCAASISGRGVDNPKKKIILTLDQIIQGSIKLRFAVLNNNQCGEIQEGSN